jgi:4'-phosphopantetheinyl transferase
MVTNTTSTASLFERESRTGLASAAVQQTWKLGPASPVIWPNEVHVWRARLDVPWSWAFDEALSLPDRARADRFRFESDRRRFCLGRGSLRLILGRYLKIRPGRLQLDTNEFGKPFLADQRASQGLRFNLTHSHQLALIAITRHREVGIDLEYRRPDFVTDEVANHFFSQNEAAQLRALPAEFKTEAFFKCWTRKEAYIKARGEGIACSLNEFDVSLRPGTAPALLNSPNGARELERWSFQDLSPAPEYAATVAFEGGLSRLVLWDLVVTGAQASRLPDAN